MGLRSKVRSSSIYGSPLRRGWRMTAWQSTVRIPQRTLPRTMKRIPGLGTPWSSQKSTVSRYLAAQEAGCYPVVTNVLTCQWNCKSGVKVKTQRIYEWWIQTTKIRDIRSRRAPKQQAGVPVEALIGRCCSVMGRVIREKTRWSRTNTEKNRYWKLRKVLLNTTTFSLWRMTKTFRVNEIIPALAGRLMK